MTAIQLDILRHPQEGPDTPAADDQTRVVTVRMPVGLHTALKSEAHRYETSLNRLALAKLRIAGKPFETAAGGNNGVAPG